MTSPVIKIDYMAVIKINDMDYKNMPYLCGSFCEGIFSDKRMNTIDEFSLKRSYIS